MVIYCGGDAALVRNESRFADNPCQERLYLKKDFWSPMGVKEVKTAARQCRESGQGNVYDHQPPVFFMDVGAWAGNPDDGPKTSFGLVCEYDILLCSWLNLREGGESISEFKETHWWKYLGDGTKAVLEGIRKQGRGFVLAWDFVPSALGRLTGKDEAFVIFPDMHLHIQAGGPLDRFRFKEKEGDEPVSLDRELRDLLDLCKSLKGIKATTFQLGDLYECWEAESILRYRLRSLKMVVDESLKYLKQRGLEYALRTDLIYLLQHHLIPLGLVLSNFETMHWLNGHSEDLTVKKNVDASRYSSIFDAIRNAHPKLFMNERKIFDYELKGNHDNNQLNLYWSSQECAPSEYYNLKELRFSTMDDQSAKKRPFFRGGDSNSIWMEHGHYWDKDNNDEGEGNDDDAWYKKGCGFDIVHSITRGAKDFWLGLGRSQSKTDFVRNLADNWTEFRAYQMRLFTLLRTDKIFSDDKNIRLVVMGHTHTPCLVQAPKGISFFWLYGNDALRYINGDHCLNAAKKFGNSIKPPGL